MKINCIWKGPAALAEGPVWDASNKILYWIDIAEHQLHSLKLETSEHHSWKMPALIGAIDLDKDGNLMAGVGDHIVKIEMPSGKVTKLIDVIKGDSELRLNDGKFDRHGRFWVGVAHAATESPRGGLYRYDPDGSLHHMETGITISNGLGWSPDDATFYYTDSLRHVIYRYDFDAGSGAISNREIFVEVPETMVPDGLTVDEEGYVWSAQWNGSKVICFTPEGVVDREIEFPTSRVTSCTFGGADLKTLFVTSCSRDVGETETLPEPAGALFSTVLTNS
ncbi:MAG: SMP-30/gluconolactonase/LRE family protein [Gammaproteobacteria bacterium]|nr:SMP-30/gluconolactonase/LRE family protein [Gammaproteobacteria bacterium]